MLHFNQKAEGVHSRWKNDILLKNTEKFRTATLFLWYNDIY